MDWFDRCGSSEVTQGRLREEEADLAITLLEDIPAVADLPLRGNLEQAVIDKLPVESKQRRVETQGDTQRQKFRFLSAKRLHGHEVTIRNYKFVRGHVKEQRNNNEKA